MNYEIIGTIASIIITISFCFNKDTVIRVVNCVGSLLFILYGLLINSFSVVFLNVLLLIIHIYKLSKKEK